MKQSESDDPEKNNNTPNQEKSFKKSMTQIEVKSIQKNTSQTQTDKPNPEQLILENNRKRNLKQGFVNHFGDYCSSTGLHGFPYLGQRRTIPEVIFWSLVLIASFCASIYLINEIYQKYLDSPIIISIASKRIQIHNIPFPAVTICPNTKFNRTCFDYERIYQRAIENETLTPKEARQFAYANYVCSHTEENFPLQNEKEFTEDIYHFLDKCKAASILECNFGNESCDDKWVPVLTEEGLCYTFNMIDRSEMFQDSVHHYGNFVKFGNKSTWDAETGSYINHNITTDDDYPKRSLYTGLENALRVMMKEPKDSLSDNCSLEVQGYKVSLHLPVRFPMPSEDFFYMPLGKKVMARIKPSMVVTPEVVKSYDPSKRVCYFPSEKKLTYFKIYTQFNCLKECLTKFTYMSCSCVDFDMPRTSEMAICGPAQQDCSTNVKGNISLFNLISLLMGGEENVAKNSFGSRKVVKLLVDNCKCLPECNEIVYDVDAAPFDFNWNAVTSNIPSTKKPINPEDAEHFYITSLTLYFSNRYVHTLERNELYGISDFISNFGGLIGLFTGFSIISAVEILYFLSLRIWGNIKLHGHWAVPRESEAKQGES